MILLRSLHVGFSRIGRAGIYQLRAMLDREWEYALVYVSV